MNNLKAEEYFLDFYKSTENEYHKLIRAVRIDSPNSSYSKKGERDSKFTTMMIVAIFRRDKKKFTIGTYIVSDFEADFETIKKGGTGYFITTNIASDENFNKKELDAFVLDEKSQLERINSWIKNIKKEGPWSIIQDAWDPSVIAEFIPRSPQPWDKKVDKPAETIIGTPSNAEMIIAGSPSIAPVELGLTFSKIQLIIDGIPGDLSIPAKTDMPWFYVYVGDLSKKVYDEFNDLGDLDPEYSEDIYRGKDDEDVNLPPVQQDVPNGLSFTEGNPSYGEYTPIIINGGVKLPTGPNAYSNTKTQGYNLTNSIWYGDLLSSALAHIDHPTFDVPDTDNGYLGCASWVSMVFYRAFGVSMIDGSVVGPTPKSIGKFGSISTATLGFYFRDNPAFWTRIDLLDGQPGDIVNTEKGAEHGHVGVVINEKGPDKAGKISWKIASNSSNGFGVAGDPKGCGRINYTLTGWKSKVAYKNPSGTACWRYKGPTLYKK